MSRPTSQSQFRGTGKRLVPDEEMPPWLAAIVRRIDGASIDELLPRPALSAPQVGRRSAVLMLFADGPDGPDVLVTARATTLRSHAGQPAFPGGKQDGAETAVDTALREAAEETGLDPGSVTPVALLPDLFLGVTGFLVSPVLAYWRTPGPVAPVDPAETAAVARVPVAQLADPARRGRVRHPSGYIGPAFEVADMVIWGFTAGLVEVLLDLGGWTIPWDLQRYITLPELAEQLPDPEAGHLGDIDDVPHAETRASDPEGADGTLRIGNDGAGNEGDDVPSMGT